MSSSRIDRWAFLRIGGATVGAAALTPLLGVPAADAIPSAVSKTALAPSVLDHAASACPIDTVVVAVMENR